MLIKSKMAEILFLEESSPAVKERHLEKYWTLLIQSRSTWKAIRTDSRSLLTLKRPRCITAMATCSTSRLRRTTKVLAERVFRNYSI